MKLRSILQSCVILAGILALAGSAMAGSPALTTELVVNGLVRPIYVTAPPGDTSRIFIIEKQGIIKIFNFDDQSVTTFLNIDAKVTGGTSTSSEQGLLGLAFHPDFANNGFFYVNYTGSGGATRVARYNLLGGNPEVADPNSEFLILTFSQPQANHNGGWIEFGPNDGYLYIATGDGGNANDGGPGHVTGGNAQSITANLLGKMLRIDVDGGSPYAIPPSNPFVGVTGLDEIWSYGLRNPWRNSFDRMTSDLYIGDVGQNAREEIDFQPASSTGGENYGWRCMEGIACTGLSGCTCNAPSLTLPIHDYTHAVGFCIIGGYVYRGSAIPGLQGTYFFADYVTNRIWSFRYVDGVVTEFEERTIELNPPGPATISNIASFGEDAAGEMYIVEQSGGEIFRILIDCPCLGDTDGDQTVTFVDLVTFLDCLSVPGGEACGCVDMDGDNSVTFADLVIFLDVLQQGGCG